MIMTLYYTIISGTGNWILVLSFYRVKDSIMGNDIKNKILEGAVIELESSGAGFRMDDLAHRLKISKRTLYENFSSKEEIVDKVLATIQNDLYEQHKQLLNDDRLTADEKIVAFFASRSRSVKKAFSSHTTVELFRKMLDLAAGISERSIKDWKLLEQFVEEAQNSNTFIKFDKNLFMYMMAGAAQSVFENLEQMENYYSYHEAMQACIRILLYGIKKNGGQSENDD